MKSEPASTVDGASPELVEVMVEADDTPTLRSKQTRPTMPPKPKKRPDTDIYKQASGDQQVLVASITEVRADGSDLVSDSGRTTPQTSSEAATSSAPAEKTRHFTTRQGKAIATSRKVIPVKGRPPLPPRIPKSIWFDFDDDPKGPTSPVLPAAAPAKRKRASRRQMFQTVLRISAVNRAADDATRAEAPENPSSSHRLHKSALRDRCRAALLLHVTTDAPIQVPRSVAALPVPLPRKVSALSAASQVWTRGLASPPFSEAPPALTETDMAQSTASAPGRTASELTWFAPTSIQAFSWSLRSYSAGLYPAATVRLSESLFFLTSRSRTAVSPIACLSGHGKYQLTTPVGTLACWPVAALARLSLRQDTAPYLHQTLGDPGLEAPPRLETSIPAATSLCAAQRCPRPSQFPTGMPATLATGEGYYRFFLLSHSTELLLLQGWPDSYQDDQDCAVCDRHRSKTPPVETLPLDRRPRTSSTISWIRCCPGESSDDNVPKVCMRHWHQALQEGRETIMAYYLANPRCPDCRALNFTWLKSLLPPPVTPFTKGSPTAIATRCPRTRSRWFRQGWTSTASTDVREIQGPAHWLGVSNHTDYWMSPPRRIPSCFFKVITYQRLTSLPGPKAGNRRDIYILSHSKTQSIRVRVAGSCHLPVGYTWRSEPPSLKSWPSSCAGHTWNDLCDRATPRLSKWRLKCGNIGKDTGETPPETCRPMSVQRCRRSPDRTWNTWWQRCAAPWTMSRLSTISAGSWAWHHSQDTSCRTDRLPYIECNRPSTPVGAGEASLLAKTAAELADNALYLMALRLLWPLLSSDQQLEVQQWFQRYARGSSAPGAASSSSCSRP